jgi:signal transduction histidine kinase/CheY-like chemotaxis protein
MNHTRQSQDSDNSRLMESRIVLEEIRMLYGSMPFSMPATLAVGLVMYIVLHAHADSLQNLHIWFSALVLITLMRGWDSWAFNHSSAEVQNREIWGTRFMAGSTASGFWWGMLSWLGYASENEYLIIIVVCLVGVAGGSLATLSYRWKTIAYFLLPLLILLEIRLVLVGSDYTNVVALLLAAFILFSLSTARRVYKNSNQNVRLRIEADYREDALRTAKDEAELANKAKSQFLSNMSHELRTPLNAILGYAQLLEYDNSLPQNQRTNLREISSAGRLLLELVNQILDLARIEEGNMYIFIEKVKLEDVFTECKALIKPLASEQNILLDFDTRDCGYARADHTRLKQVILNLLSNAIKYNRPNGSVTLRCGFINDNRVRIEIEDTGIGIPRQQIENLFKPFDRLNIDSRDIEGTGIGLSISRQLTELMGGTMNVSSEPNRGSLFFIELEGYASVTPDRIAEPASPFYATPRGNGRVLQKRKILIVEDNPANLKLIANQLRTLGYKPDLASNGREALKMFHENDYALVLSDCNMPIMDGYQLATEIRASGNTETPIIALTADAFPEREKECLLAGMNDRIIKPVGLHKLRVTLERWLTDTAG